MKAVKDVTPVLNELLSKPDAVTMSTRSAIEAACADGLPLRRAVLRLVENDPAKDHVFRLVPFAVLGALTGTPEPALSVCVVSRLWWLGAQTLDDLLDGHYDATRVGLSSAEATVASVACISLLPQAVIAHLGVSDSVERAWTAELLTTSLRSASGQLDDVATDAVALCSSRVIKSYAGKSGAPYARDIAMAAALAGATPEQLRGWRAFGALFGVLRQLANDRVTRAVEDDEDLANGTRTLLLAHAFETIEPAEQAELAALRARTRTDMTARRALRRWLADPDIVDTYHDRIATIRRKLSVLLVRLVTASDYRDALQWMINFTADHSRVETTKGAK